MNRFEARAFGDHLVKTAILGDILVAPIDSLLSKSLKPDPDSRLTERVVEDARAKGYDVVFSDNPFDAHHDGRNKRVVVPRNSASVAAHELGHAALDQSRFGRVLQNPFTNLSLRLSSRSGLLSGALRARADVRAGKERAGLKETVGKSLVVPGLMAAPHLAVEGLASIKGMRTLRRLGADKEHLRRARGNLIKAWSTYATEPVAGAINDAAMYHLTYSPRHAKVYAEIAKDKAG